ncbi:hypothetical protein INS49_013933 [Diaporthe citri]|uniref:uncharacterized protein n=1 Tax=Diaporthe citri TaxID=83186 RepID=UPI001C809B34|nr:uncharacterized protein INS49_013933 [Diaporthe citri]KAG6358049.1 hypothetical protein INS49_013933 [Diaporthe citri]
MAEKKGPGIWAVDQSTHKQNDLELFESGVLADVEVKCGDHTWKLHKVILCTRSTFFKSALMGAFKESETGIVTLKKREQCDVGCFLKFIYTGSIDLQDSYPGDDALVALMRIWKTADFFCHGSLCKLAVHAANDYAKEHAQVFCTAFPGADHDKEMDEIIEQSFKPAVRFVYSEEMKDFVSTFVPIYKRLATASVHRLSNSEAFQTLLREVPQFAAELVTSLMRSFKIWAALVARAEPFTGEPVPLDDVEKGPHDGALLDCRCLELKASLNGSAGGFQDIGWVVPVLTYNTGCELSPVQRPLDEENLVNVAHDAG